jgi:hypothetical protein
VRPAAGSRIAEPGGEGRRRWRDRKPELRSVHQLASQLPTHGMSFGVTSIPSKNVHLRRGRGKERPDREPRVGQWEREQKERGN